MTAELKRLTPAEILDFLRGEAQNLRFQRVPVADQLMTLRAEAQSFGFSIRDNELRGLIWEARRQATGAGQPITQADEIDLTPTPWLWDGLVIGGCLNLLVSLPKIGKTSLLLAWVAAWHRGEWAFLDRELVGPCPPVLIVGTDQPMVDWARMMEPLGLVVSTGANKGRLQPPIFALHASGNALHLDPEGIERITAYASEHPGLLIVLDSMAACMRPLGIEEKSEEYAGPIGDLMEAIGPYGATVVAIHHSNKGRSGESATLASRGGTALPAAASQTIKLSRLSSGQQGATDRRIVIETEGRAGLPVKLLIERVEDQWISHGDAESVSQAQQLAEQEDQLPDAHHAALEAVRELCSGDQWTTAGMVADRLQLAGRDADRTARKRLDSLARRGLLQSETITTPQGLQKRFRPVEVRTPSAHVLADPSDPSAPSAPLQDRTDRPTFTRSSSSREKEGADGADREDRPDRMQGCGHPAAEVVPDGADQPAPAARPLTGKPPTWRHDPWPAA